MAQCKTHYKCQALIVTGCLAERYKEEIYKEIPEVDAVIGTSSYDAIAEAVEQALEGKKPQVFKDLNRLPGYPDGTCGYYRWLFCPSEDCRRL